MKFDKNICILYVKGGWYINNIIKKVEGISMCEMIKYVGQCKRLWELVYEMIEYVGWCQKWWGYRGE